MKAEHLQVCKRAVKVFGEDDQLEMVIEECAEVVQAIQKLKRAKRGHYAKIEEAKANLVDEVADLLIMAEQARLIMGTHLVDSAVGRKLKRLEGRLNEHERVDPPTI